MNNFDLSYNVGLKSLTLYWMPTISEEIYTPEMDLRNNQEYKTI